IPVIGYLSGGSPGSFARLVDAFRLGLSDQGYVDGRSVALEYRWAEGQPDRLPELAADLAQLEQFEARFHVFRGSGLNGIIDLHRA
ncbi:MAG: hypothetical protein ACREVW_13285, partial [Burkholderiales bacterium]